MLIHRLVENSMKSLTFHLKPQALKRGICLDYERWWRKSQYPWKCHVVAPLVESDSQVVWDAHVFFRRCHLETV